MSTSSRQHTTNSELYGESTKHSDKIREQKGDWEEESGKVGGGERWGRGEVERGREVEGHRGRDTGKEFN